MADIPVSGAFNTTDPSDTYAVTRDEVNQGGHRAVADATARNAITSERRKFGMLVATQSDGKLWMLKNIAMGGVSNTLTDNSNWLEFSGGSGGYYVPGTEVVADNNLLVGTTASAGGFENTIVLGSTGVATSDSQIFADREVYQNLQFPGLDVVQSSRRYQFGDLINDGGLIDLDQASFEYTRNTARWIASYDDGGGNNSGSVAIGDLEGGFNGTIFTVDDFSTYFTFAQAGDSFRMQVSSSGVPVFTYGTVGFKLPPTNGTSGQVLSTNGAGVTSWVAQTTGGATTVGSIDTGTASANGAQISGSNLIMQSASSTRPGLVNNTTQTFSGTKTFDGPKVILAYTGGAGVSPALQLPNGTADPVNSPSADIMLFNRANELKIYWGVASGSTTTIAPITNQNTNHYLPSSSGTLATTGGLTTVGTGGSDAAWDITTGLLSIPSASASARGLVTVGSQTFNGVKTFGGTINLRTGSATAGTAPLKFTSGALLTVAVVGTMEFLTDKLYHTITTGTARKEVTLNDIALTSGRMPFSTTNGRLTDDAGITFDTTNGLKLNTTGLGFGVKEGTNARMGTATLTAGTVTVSTTKVTATSRIFLTINGGTVTNVGTVYVSARTAGTSFTITSTNVLDASNVAWIIMEPT